MSLVDFAVIGDYGVNNSNEADVARLIKSKSPDFIATVGDNIYAAGGTFDTSVGKYYADYIGNYKGAYGDGSATNRFFPAMGDHDWRDGGGVSAYLNYFTLPGNERYYSFTKGAVQFFVIDANAQEPDGASPGSKQAQWLETAMKASTAQWQVVLSGTSPYSSGIYGPNSTYQWAFEKWGADAVISGDEHHYERMMKDVNGDGVKIPYIVNGTGGAALRSFGAIEPDSVKRYNADHGGLIGKADEDSLSFEFWSTAGGGTLIDKHTITKAAPTPAPTPTPTDSSPTPTLTDSAPTPTVVNGTASSDMIKIGVGTHAALAGKETIVNGLAGNDALVGSSGKDQLKGGIGADRLDGAGGNDILTGEAGFDAFVFKAIAGVDTITDFSVADDTIWLGDTAFRKLSLSPSVSDSPQILNQSFFAINEKPRDSNDYLIYNSGTGTLTYDADGSGAGVGVVFAQLSKGLALSYKDFIVA
jgi:tartrate-resistant acid phosphatase type 5